MKWKLVKTESESLVGILVFNVIFSMTFNLLYVYNYIYNFNLLVMDPKIAFEEEVRKWMSLQRSYCY